MAKYINPYTDFGFKKLFGEEGNKDLRIDFLNQQRAIYEENLIQYWGMKSALETAVEEREIEIARKLIKRNLTNEEISEDTGLTVAQVEQLRSEND